MSDGVVVPRFTAVPSAVALLPQRMGCSKSKPQTHPVPEPKPAPTTEGEWAPPPTASVPLKARVFGFPAAVAAPLRSAAETKSNERARSARVSRLSNAKALDIDRGFLASRGYEIRELLGQGGFGQVALAVHSVTGESYVHPRCARGRQAVRSQWRPLPRACIVTAVCVRCAAWLSR